jgi:tripartite-type tricarboxylate transporter receptor subunit TctC
MMKVRFDNKMSAAGALQSRKVRGIMPGRTEKSRFTSRFFLRMSQFHHGAGKVNDIQFAHSIR